MADSGDAVLAGHDSAACVLLYGDNLPLHQRVLRSVLQGLPEPVELRIGLNAVGQSTLEFLSQNLMCFGGHDRPSVAQLAAMHTDYPWNGYWSQGAGRLTSVFTVENVNSLKYPIMRLMFHTSQLFHPQWWLWFDDDSWFTEIDQNQSWQAPAAPGRAWAAIERAMDESEGYFGKPLYCAWEAGQFDWVRARGWYRGMAPELLPHGKFGATFAAGGFFGVKHCLVDLLDWPPEEMRHNGGDTMLGEALRQQGIRVHALDCAAGGIRVDDGKRRGYSEPPTGSLAWREQRKGTL